jgi:hypothetical protein
MTALDQLPSRIASKLESFDNKVLRTIRLNRLTRNHGDYALHMRRHHIYVACIEIGNARRAVRLAALRAELA